MNKITMAERFEILYAIAEHLNRQTQLQPMLETTLELILQVTQVSGGWISLLDEANGFFLAAAHGLPPALAADEHAALRWSPCRCQRMFLNGELVEPLNIIQCERLERLAETGRETGNLRTHLTVPLVSGDKALGVLNLVRAGGADFEESERTLFALIADMLSVAIERLQAQQELQELSRRLEQRVGERTFELQTLYELSQRIGYTLDYAELLHLIQSSLHGVLDCDLSASLLAADPAAGRHEHILTYFLPRPVEPKWKEWARANIVTVFSKLRALPPDALQELKEVEQHGPGYETASPAPEQDHEPGEAGGQTAGERGSFFNVPLIVEGETIGLLHVASRRPDTFDEHHVRLLYTVAAQAGVAVQRLQSLLARERAHLEAVVAGLDEGLILLDADGRSLLINPAAGRLLRQLGLPVPARGEPFPALDSLSLPSLIAAGNGQDVIMQQIATWGEEPGPFVELWARPLEAPFGSGVLLLLRDVTEQRRYEEELRRLSTTDPLTGLANRRHLMEALQREIARSRRYQIPLALIMFDLDNLKGINDTYGHLVGDQALCQVAETLRRNVRGTDLAARYGGDEFVLLLPHTTLDQAEYVARRLLDSVRQSPLENGASLSISLGVAALEAMDDDRGETLLARADQALYLAKQAGRGCVRVLVPTEMEPEKEVEMGAQKDPREQALRQARAEMEMEVKQEIVDIFRELLERMWERLAGLIGESNTQVIFHSALLESSRDFPFLQDIVVHSDGIRLQGLLQNRERLDRATLRAGLLAFTDRVVALLTDLTGNILVRKVAPLVQRLRQELGDEEAEGKER